MNFFWSNILVFEINHILSAFKCVVESLYRVKLFGELKFTSLHNMFCQVPIMKKIRTEYITNPDFDPAKVVKASSAAEGLCKWILAMEVYDRVAKVSTKNTSMRCIKTTAISQA